MSMCVYCVSVFICRLPAAVTLNICIALHCLVLSLMHFVAICFSICMSLCQYVCILHICSVCLQFVCTNMYIFV